MHKKLAEHLILNDKDYISHSGEEQQVSLYTQTHTMQKQYVPARLQRLTISFCTLARLSMGISTARSPLATMMPSLTYTDS